MKYTHSREEILSEVRRLSANTPDDPIGRERFSKLSGIKTGNWGRFWAKWSDVLHDAGLTPNEFTGPSDRDLLLESLAEITRKLQRVPTYNEMRVERHRRPDFPLAETYRKRLGSKAQLNAALAEWIARHPDFADIAGLIPEPTADDSVAAQAESDPTGPAVLSNSYVPPVIACLPALARMDGEQPIEFERRVAIAFEILGLDVARLGQGTGREPDGIARCHRDGWAVIYDAKARAGGYRLQTEDRKFREYIERYTHELQAKGMTKLYFVVVSSRFSAADLSRARDLVRATDVKAVSLVEASALVAIVEQHLRSPLAFGLKQYERAFSETRVVTMDNFAT